MRNQKKSVLLLAMSGVVIVALLLASCGQTPPSEEKPAPSPAQEKQAPAPVKEEKASPPAGPEMIKIRATKTDGTVIEKQVEKPRYGGVFNLVSTVDTRFFDSTQGHPGENLLGGFTNDVLMQGDWSKGPAGTEEASFLFISLIIAPRFMESGSLAESWEMPDADTIVYHIRKGVRFHNKPPVNGREMTADDVLFSLKRLWEVPTSIYPAGAAGVESITAPDKWTVIIKCKPGRAGVIWRYATWYSHIYPQDVVKAYGNMHDWRNSSGTGPFMLTDYVSGSSATLMRNPNYWMKDPLHPDNRLPYLDSIKWLIIPDVSTRMAALRSGKIDWLGAVEWEDAASLVKTNSQLKNKEYPSQTAFAVHWRMDKPELPWHDIKVRRALNMAVDQELIAKTYYGGHAAILPYPILNVPEFKDIFIPLDKLPETTRELYEYHPDKAKQLLAEAGYPNGFKAEVVCYQPHVDLLSIIKGYWAKIGVDLDIQVKEYGAYGSLVLAVDKKFPQMASGGVTCTVPDQLPFVRHGNVSNFSMVKDPRIEEAYAAITAAYFDVPKKFQLIRDINLYLLEQDYSMVLPGPYINTFWQPWVKNYQGELYVGMWATTNNFVNYVWLDQDLKEKITGKR